MKFLALMMVLATAAPLMAQENPYGDRLINIGKPIHYVMPTFPEGVSPSSQKVRLRFTVTETGTVDPDSIEVIETSDVRYNQNAIDALSQYRYKPRIVNGEAVPTPNSRILIEWRVTVR